MAARLTTHTYSALNDLAPEPDQPVQPPLTLRELDDIKVQRIKGVGSRRGDALASIGIKSVFDLLTHYPIRHVDRTRLALIGEAAVGDELTVTGVITRVQSRRFGPGGRRTLVQVQLADETGTMGATFFNQPWRESQLSLGQRVAMFGKVDLYRNNIQMANPVVDLIGDATGVMVPIYPQSPKARLMTWEFANWVTDALRRCEQRGITDPLPPQVRTSQKLLDRHTALKQFHNPATQGQIQPARARLVFDELMRVQMMLRHERLVREENELGIAHDSLNPVTASPTNPALTLWHQFTDLLPFQLTGAQKNTIAQIEADMSLTRPMHRLLQGDVGSGKTLVAARVLLAAVDEGHQGALMVPTEVLAEQHYRNLHELFKGLKVSNANSLEPARPVKIKLLVGSLTQKTHKNIRNQLRSGFIDIVVGTHTLIQEAVKFHDLSAVVVDEQHRFGVEQRARLRESGRTDNRMPHMLVMTATPIPRTAAMTVYGDLDVSVLDEMPPGRTPVQTQLVRGGLDQELMWSHVREQVAQGKQVFVVCPLIEDSEAIQASSAESTFNELRESELAAVTVRLLHGRMSADAKEKVMNAFHSNNVDVLVSTTVIEVGVDVPNATVMVILSADRFGMAQLHQLRGRVGRGAHASYCYLVTEEEINEIAEQRLAALVATTDGFKLAEEDLRLRGEGTLFDESQSGRSDLKLASLVHDREWVILARDIAKSLLQTADDLTTQPQLANYADEIGWFVERREGLDAAFLQRG